MTSTADMCEVYFERDVEVYNEESPICTGDGTMCVECGKAFTHPFYFSTHISSHASQREFNVVGQCALCGLVFSDEKVFASHMISSQTRLNKQVLPENDDTDLGFSDVEPEDFTQTDPSFKENNFETDSDVLNTESLTSADKNDSSNMTDGQKPKRKRKAPDRFDPDSQLTPIKMNSDPEVEAYLMSLHQMGFTVDPGAFSRHKGGKSSKKNNAKRGRGRKGNTMLEDVGDSSQDGVPPKKASPKYEYVDIEDSPDDDPEVQPINGKLTRGQRLEQRKERLSKITEPSTDKNIKVQLDDSLSAEESELNNDITQDGDEFEEKSNTGELPLTILDVKTVTDDGSLPTSYCGDETVDISDPNGTLFSSSSDIKNDVSNNLDALNVDKINAVGTPPVSQGNRINTVTRTHVTQGNKINSFAPSPASRGGKINSFAPSPASRGGMINSFTPSPASRGGMINSFNASRGGKMNSFTPSPVSRGGMTNSFTPSSVSRGGMTNSFIPSRGGKINSFVPSPVSQGGKINSFTPSQGGKMNSFTPSPILQGSKISSFPPSSVMQGSTLNTLRPNAISHTVSNNVQHRNLLTSSVRGRGNGIMSMDNNNIVINLDDVDEDKNNSLEDSKRGSRDNVQHMLQSVGMIALTSSSLAQGKMFSSQKSKPIAREMSFSSNGRANMFSGSNQPTHSRGGFQNRPLHPNQTLRPLQKQYQNSQNRFRSNPIDVRGQVGSSGTWTNNHASSQRHQEFASPQNFKNNAKLVGSYPPAIDYNRGRGAHGIRGQHTFNNLRGGVSSVPFRGQMKPSTNTAQSAGVFRSQGSNASKKQTKPHHSTNEIIIIDDDNDVEVINIDDDDNTNTDLEKDEGVCGLIITDISSGAQTSEDVKTCKERDSDINAILECSLSGFKTNKDSECVSSTAAVIDDSTAYEQLPYHEDESLDIAETDTEVENDLTKSNPHIRNRADSPTPEYSQTEKENNLPKSSPSSPLRNSADSPIAEYSQNGKENDLCKNKVDDEDVNDDDSNDGLIDNVDIMPGEDIEGWKVCLADDSDNESSASSDKTHKVSLVDDNHHLPQPDHPKQDHCSSTLVEIDQETPQPDSSSQHSYQNPASETLDHSPSPHNETSPESLTCGTCSPQNTSLSSPKQDNSLSLSSGVMNKIDSHTLDSSEQQNIMKLCSDIEENSELDCSTQISYNERQETNMETEGNQDNMVFNSSNSLDETNLPHWPVKSRSESQSSSNFTSFQDNFAAFINRLPDFENKVSHLEVEKNDGNCEIDIREDIHEVHVTDNMTNSTTCAMLAADTTADSVICDMATDNSITDSFNFAALTTDNITNSIKCATVTAGFTTESNKCAMLTDDTITDSSSCAMLIDGITTNSANCVELVADTTMASAESITDNSTEHKADHHCQLIQTCITTSQFPMPAEPVTSDNGDTTLLRTISQKESAFDINLGITEICPVSSDPDVSLHEKCIDNIESVWSSTTLYFGSDVSSDKSLIVSSVFEGDADIGTTKTDSHSVVSSNESLDKLFEINQLSTQPSSSVFHSKDQISDHSANSMCDAIVSNSLASNSVISTGFIRGDNNSLLDIFTEIEKTCKEMVETVDNDKKNREQQANKEAEVVEEKWVLLDNEDNLESVRMEEGVNEAEHTELNMKGNDNYIGDDVGKDSIGDGT